MNRKQSFAPICEMFSWTLRPQQNNQRNYGRKANSVSSSCDSLASLISTGAQGRMPWNETEFKKPRSVKRSDNLEKELEVLAKELLPRVLKIPFTVEQWMSAINSVCGRYAFEGSGDEYSDEDFNQRKRFPYSERPKLPMIGLASMEKRLRDPVAKYGSKEASPPLPPGPQKEITLRVPDPTNLPIIWVPKLAPQTAKLLQSMPCEMFKDIHRKCKFSDKQSPQNRFRSPRQTSSPKRISSKPEPKPKPKPIARRKRRKPCCCCCRMRRQELEDSRSDQAMGKAYRAPSKPASAPSPAKSKPQPKPAPKPKAKPKPIAKPVPKTTPSVSGPAEPKAAAEPEETAKKEEPPKVEVKPEEPKPAAKPTKTGSESSSEEDSSEPNTPPATPAAPGPAAPPAGGGKDFMASLFAGPPGGSAAPSGASSPKPAGGADWMKEFGVSGASSPKPPASTGADWLTGGASPAAPATPKSGADWLTGATTPKPTSSPAAADWLS